MLSHVLLDNVGEFMTDTSGVILRTLFQGALERYRDARNDVLGLDSCTHGITPVKIEEDDLSAGSVRGKWHRLDYCIPGNTVTARDTFT
jgi:hypothetical protein